MRPLHPAAAMPLNIHGERKLFADYWLPASNATPLHLIGREHTQPCTLLRLCKQHAAWLQPKSVLDNFQHSYGTSLDCKVCDAYNNEKPRPFVSQYERVAHRAITDLPPDLALNALEWHTDAHVLSYILHGNKSSVDVYVPRFQLCIMVDGEHHFKRKRNNKRRFTKDLTASAVKQQEIDRKFNHAALEAGHNVLRLHYLDKGLFQSVVFWCVKACRRGKLKNKILFSKHFDEATRQEYADKLQDLQALIADLKTPQLPA